MSKTRIRDLQMQYGDVMLPAWPPRWAISRDRASVPTAIEEGTLTWIERMPHGIGLWLTRRLDGVAHRGSLLWSGPPSLTELECALRGQIGHVMREVGDAEIDQEAMPMEGRAKLPESPSVR